jgi:hypothetical protein
VVGLTDQTDTPSVLQHVPSCAKFSGPLREELQLLKEVDPLKTNITMTLGRTGRDAAVSFTDPTSEAAQLK